MRLWRGVGMKTEAHSEFQDGDEGMMRHVEDSSPDLTEG